MKLIPTAYYVESPTRKISPLKSATPSTNNNANGNSNGYVNGSVQQQQQQQQSSKSIVPFPTTSPPENEKGVDRLLLLARYPNANEQNIQLTLQQKQIQKEVAMISATKKAQLFRDKLQQQQRQQRQEEEEEQTQAQAQTWKWKRKQKQQRQKEEEQLKMQQQQQQYPSYYQQQPPLALFQPAYFDKDDDVEEGRVHFQHGDLHDNTNSNSNSTNTTTNSILPRRSKDSSGTDDKNDDDDYDDNTTEYDTAGIMMWQQQSIIDNNTTPSKRNVRSQSIIDKSRRSFISSSGNRKNVTSKRRSIKKIASNFMEKVFSTTIDNDSDSNNNIPPIRLDNDDNEDTNSESELPIMTDEVASTSQSIVSASDCSLYTGIGSRGGDTISSKISNPNSVMTRKISNVTTSNMNDYDNMNMNMNMNPNQNNQNRIRGNSESTAHRSTDDHGDESNNNINDNDDEDESGSGSKKGLLFLRRYCCDRKNIATITVEGGTTETATPTVKPTTIILSSTSNEEQEMVSSSVASAAAAAADTVADNSTSSTTTYSDGTNLILQVPTNRPTSNTNINSHSPTSNNELTTMTPSQSPTTKVVSPLSSSLLPTSNPTKTLFSAWTWTDLGAPMMGTEIDQQYGQSVAISHDGNIMAVGASGALSQSGVVRIYQLSKDGTGWISITSLLGRNEGDQFGSTVALSADGSVLAVSEPFYNGRAGDKTGNVRTYVRSPFGGYIRLGQDIEGDSATDHFGLGLALSSNGRRLAVGAPYRDNSESSNNGSSSNRLVSGAVKVYEWSIPDDKWMRIVGDNNNIDEINDAVLTTTAPLIGASDLDWFGWSLDLNDDGSLLCVGAPRNSDFGGYVQCFEEQKEDSPFNHIQWTLVGDTIRNNNKPVRYDDNFGAAISISRDPTGTRHRVAIAAPGKNGTKKSLFDSGIVIVYEFNPNSPERGWIQLGRTDIASVNPGKDFQMGYSIDLHGDLLLVGVPGAASNNAGGQMELFEFERSSWHWKRQPRIFQGLTGSNYGSAVRMTPDGTTIVVGSPQSEENNYGGAINVYRKD
ncbi:hypothetical protein FRACYDRAFT_254944 [Fragilariopsis cylindrus CCMP1102]|uniref:Uncharacterized protein n=1 Tax=Fragilariopsis cylindrus CCMP1102 TaxID=635003 RepID=A0A1E7EKE8_9STRA|nr:hypothetical protein FRACYDRAFT_254944 [Fragilariopsis cylindrus CCMP1102]|eukprot:OEU06347.1 hypothetical protein FRACYDRAFT_254944 [Fragilariopsis cylindrus CCMP1102]